MPNLTLRLDARQHAEIARRATLAGLSIADYIRRAALADDSAGLIREIHRAVVGGNGGGLSDEGRLALEALTQAGISAGEARGRVERAILAAPKADAATIIREALRKDS